MAENKWVYIREEYCRKYNFSSNTKYKVEEEILEGASTIFILKNNQSDLVGIQKEFLILADP